MPIKCFSKCHLKLIILNYCFAVETIEKTKLSKEINDNSHL